MGEGAEDIRKVGLRTPISAMAGIGPKRLAALEAKGIRTVEDLLFHLPARYQDWRERSIIAQLKPGTITVVEGVLSGVRERPMPGARWRRLVSATLTDAAGAHLRLVWFNLPSYMRGRIPEGVRVAAYGRVTQATDELVEMMQPELRSESFEDGSYNDKGGPIRPVYRLPEGIPPRLYASMVATALDTSCASIAGAIPEPQRVSQRLPTIAEALEYLHRPPAEADLTELARGRSMGHQTLAFNELYAFELAMCIERERSKKRPGMELRGTEEHGPKSLVRLTERFIETIPFQMTGAQRRTIEEIGSDLASPRQMNRILIGDVGSGKTAVAFWAMLRAVESGTQAIMMAPTELLAEQHHRSFGKLCGTLRIRSELLTGRIGSAAHRAILKDLANGNLHVVFGTQALIQEKVRIAKLGLGIVDEQHRFGVFDRAKLKALGPRANILMMTATPIPRSLAMSLFANLDVSVLDELPPGRTPISTEIFPENSSKGSLDEVDAIVAHEIASGHRAYYVLPLIETDDEEEELKTVNAMAARMKRGRLRDTGIGILHGRMRAIEKDRVMREFRDGIIKVLIATTVVEVGIDVPEATVIAIIAAERYGLAQLHQLRGRVGRGRDASRCCLVMSHDADEAAAARLQVMVEHSTGNAIAQADLEMRGPGDLLGARQTGALPLRFLRYIKNPMMIGKARAMAEEWLKHDAGLKTPASRGAKTAVRKLLALGFSLADVG